MAGRAPRAPRSPPTSAATPYDGRAGAARRRGRQRPAPVSSANACLTVQRGPDGRLMHVDVDAGWLCAARPDQLERAVIQACRFGTEA